MAISTVANSVSYSNPINSNVVANAKPELQNIGSAQADPAVSEIFGSPKSQQEGTDEELKKHTDEMNQMMAALNTDLRFSLHEKTKQLMVQMVDVKTNEVVKEFPPHEFLDTIAKIRDYVGLILDKKA